MLGPVLFVIHINDLPQCLLHSSINMYADDTVIYYSGSEVSSIRNNLQEDLNRVDQWLVNSKLILNQSKTKGLLFGTRQLLQTTSDFVLQIQSKDIERVTKFTYLGTILDEQLHWKEHIDTTCKKVNKRLGLLARIRSCLTLKAAKCVYNTLLEPILSYTDTAWGELSVDENWLAGVADVLLGAVDTTVLLELVSMLGRLLTCVGVDSSIGSATSGDSPLGSVLLVDLVSRLGRFV